MFFPSEMNPQSTSCFTSELTLWGFEPSLSVLQVSWKTSGSTQPPPKPSSLSPHHWREIAAPPPSSSLLIFPSPSYPGKPPATVSMTHSTHLLYCTVGGPPSQNNNLDPISLEHLSAKCSHKKSKPHIVLMLTSFDGWSSLTFRLQTFLLNGG